MGKLTDYQDKSKTAFDTASTPAKPALDPADLVLRPITHADADAYRDYYKGLSDPHHFSGLLAGRDLDARETYTDLFDNTIGTGSIVMFGMWHDDKLIGQSALNFFDTPQGKLALLAGSEIADDYRGQRLVNLFYQARMQHLESTEFAGTIQTTIKPDNHSSQKAALRNGFINTGERDEYGLYIFTPAAPAQPATNQTPPSPPPPIIAR